MSDSATRTDTVTRKGRKPRFTRESIVKAAVDLADAHGLEQVTMARVAASVGCTPMALYSHVENHDALLRAMADQVLGELEGQFDTMDWESAARHWLHILWNASMKREWLVEVILVNDRITLQWLRFNERLVNILERAGLPYSQVADTLILVGCVAVSAIFQVIKLPLPRSAVVVDGMEERGQDELDTGLWANLLPHLGNQSNESFLRDIEDLIIMGIAAKTATPDAPVAGTRD